MNQRAAILAVMVSSVLAHEASAETKSWTAIKGKLPADTALVLGFDVAAARGTAVYGKLVAAVAGMDHDITEGLGLLKSACQIDPTTAITDVTITLNEHEKGIIAFGVVGLDEPKLIACANAIQAKDDPKKTLSSKVVGGVTEYTMTGEKDKLYVAWLARDVLAFSTEPDKRKLIDTVIAGKPATGALAANLGKTNTSALVWGAGAIDKDEIKGGFGAVTLQKDTVVATATLTMKSAETGKAMLGEAQKELAKGTAEVPKTMPELVAAMKSIKLTGNGADLSATASLKLADLATLVPQLLKLM